MLECVLTRGPAKAVSHLSAPVVLKRALKYVLTFKINEYFVSWVKFRRQPYRRGVRKSCLLSPPWIWSPAFLQVCLIVFHLRSFFWGQILVSAEVFGMWLGVWRLFCGCRMKLELPSGVCNDEFSIDSASLPVAHFGFHYRLIWRITLGPIMSPKYRYAFAGTILKTRSVRCPCTEH